MMFSDVCILGLCLLGLRFSICSALDACSDALLTTCTAADPFVLPGLSSLNDLLVVILKEMLLIVAKLLNPPARFDVLTIVML